MFENQQTDYWT